MKQMFNSIIIGLVASMCLVTSESRQNDEEEGYRVCSTDVCKERAKLINESMLQSANACYDFHSYACGGWENNPNLKWRYGVYYVLKDKVKTAIKHILESIVPNSTNQNITDKVAIIFNACIAFENTTDQPDGIVNVLTSYGLGDWPLLGNTTSDATLPNNVTDTVVKTGSIGLFDLFVRRDPLNSTSYVIQIRQPEVYAAYDKGYKEAMKQAALLIRPDINETKFMEYITRVVEFKAKLRFLDGKGPHPDNQVGRATIGDLEKNYSSIPLLELLNNEFSKVNINLTADDIVELYPLNYYEVLNNSIENFDPTTMYNFAGARVLSALGEQASKNFSKVFPEDLSEFSRGERSTVCAEIIRSNMKEAHRYLYEQHRFNASVKKEVEDISRRIKDAFKEMFENNSWIDDTTKKTLQEKIPHIPINATFVEMLHILRERSYRRELKKLRQPYEEGQFHSGMSASYDRNENTVEIPWSLLQPPLYEPGLPLSLNIGGIGGIIGHEIFHAFGVEGNYIRPAENLTRSILNNRTQCFVTQYESFLYIPPGMQSYYKIKGKQTLEENVADTVGLQVALNAYNKLLEEDCDNIDTRLEGLEMFSGKQELCRAMNKLQLGLLIAYNKVSPPRHRINVPMKNIEEFAAAFNCSEGSPQSVTSNQTCALW